MNQRVIIAVIVILLIGFGVWAFTSRNNDSEVVQENTSTNTSENESQGDNSTTSPSGDETQQSTYTLSQVAEHDTREDCWLALEGKVYNVTSFIASGNHPGGEAIVQGCGKDATALFNTRPMGSGTPHSQQARSFLPNFYIGDLAQ